MHLPTKPVIFRKTCWFSGGEENLAGFLMCARVNLSTASHSPVMIADQLTKPRNQISLLKWKLLNEKKPIKSANVVIPHTILNVFFQNPPLSIRNTMWKKTYRLKPLLKLMVKVRG